MLRLGTRFVFALNLLSSVTRCNGDVLFGLASTAPEPLRNGMRYGFWSRVTIFLLAEATTVLAAPLRALGRLSGLAGVLCAIGVPYFVVPFNDPYLIAEKALLKGTDCGDLKLFDLAECCFVMSKRFLREFRLPYNLCRFDELSSRSMALVSDATGVKFRRFKSEKDRFSRRFSSCV